MNLALMEKDKIITTIAENVRNLMNEANLSNTELARRSKISAGTISRILSGSMSITIPVAMKLAAGLNVEIALLLKGLDDPRISKKETVSDKAAALSIGVLSINDKRITCIKNQEGEIIGTSKLRGGLDLTETSGSLMSLIQEAITAAISAGAADHSLLKNAKLNLVTQSYEFLDTRNKFILFARKTFKEVLLMPDWQITYLTAFNNHDGISLVVDMGVSCSYKQNGLLKKLGGWKFPVYDLGGENWLGIEAIRHTIDAAEGYCPMTDLAQKVLSKFDGKIERITEKCFKGADRDVYGEFSKILLESYFRGDGTAKAILEKGFKLIYRSIEKIDETLGKPLKITVSGSLTDIYKPFFPENRLVSSSSDSEKAALLANLSRDFLLANGIRDL